MSVRQVIRYHCWYLAKAPLRWCVDTVPCIEQDNWIQSVAKKAGDYVHVLVWALPVL